MKSLTWLLALTMLFSCKHRETHTCIRVIDGDTFVIENGDHIRMAEIDAPEHNQAEGPEATKYLAGLISGKTVSLYTLEQDEYGRTIAEVYDMQGTWINKKMVTDGHAWAYKRYAGTEIYQDWLTARQAKVGMWVHENQSPYLFRKAHKHLFQ